MRKLAIDAVGTFDRGGALLLRGFLQRALEQQLRITVWCSPELGHRLLAKELHYQETATESALAKWRWATWGWRAASRRADLRFSFNGFSIAPQQTVFVHNALYYDATARDRLDRGMRLKLAVLKQLTDRAIHNAGAVIVQSAWMAGFMPDGARVVRPVLGATTPSDAELLVGPGPRLLNVGNDVGFKDLATFWEAHNRVGGSAYVIGNFNAHRSTDTKHWLGALDRPDVFACYRDADVLVMTSLAESMGLPLVEAMQSGLPIVAPRLPYATELCGDAALYFAPGDPQSCADTIRQALDEQTQNTLRDAGERRIQQLLAERGFDAMVDTVCNNQR